MTAKRILLGKVIKPLNRAACVAVLSSVVLTPQLWKVASPLQKSE
jgi:hypothetical protein